MTQLGMSFQFLIPSVAATFSTTNSVGTNSVFIVLKQTYYIATVEYSGSGSSFFKSNVKPEDLKNVIYPQNPPCYINSVSYGRLAIAKVSSDYDIDKMKASLDLKFGAFSGGLTTEASTILNNCSYEVVAYGGPSISSWDIDKLSNYFKNGDIFTNISGAVPISFSTNYLIDNSPFFTPSSSSYQITTCE